MQLENLSPGFFTGYPRQSSDGIVPADNNLHLLHYPVEKLSSSSRGYIPNINRVIKIASSAVKTRPGDVSGDLLKSSLWRQYTHSNTSPSSCSLTKPGFDSGDILKQVHGQSLHTFPYDALFLYLTTGLLERLGEYHLFTSAPQFVTGDGAAARRDAPYQ